MLIVPLKKARLVNVCVHHKDSADACNECVHLGITCKPLPSLAVAATVLVVVVIIYPDNKFAC